ncbi:alanine--tRNA ligase, mitochondrial isoform X2 [Sabethes cyaneus]|uniref:alanine--tRNA ligase, mitochondrial isoform X2 n=1 Tax=Sabethes cyaneus TaxID=53552 RepID=UPI00237EB0BF|nr:alanine--tRNA ligase, mitochondrial isoform X2 [Sabethes cyaneus]
MYRACPSHAKLPSSKEIRQRFLDFFIGENGHQFVRSSSVVPFSDPTIAFVNAGMNQFKNVFLGTADAPYPRVANSQKCVRVGGKHNDIGVVGTDGYHHTFFEMLGNWSFGDYFKAEACDMAWRLLRDGYGIDTRRLYVTYFGGDEAMGLPADIECRDIWASLGVSPERIIPFGASDNFWEMGNSGPCGPCSEIHIDHSDHFLDTEHRRHFVNAGRPDLTEVWNLVFVQHSRSLDNGKICNLPQQHVDTGLGLERLVSHLQGKSSNYDTDLFMPLIQHIHKVTGKFEYSGVYDIRNEKFELDTAYRLLADHSRMITACLSDGMFPSQNHKLRRVLRRSLSLSERIFDCPTLVRQLIPLVVESLGETYPEMEKKLSDTTLIIQHEEESYRKLCSNLRSESRTLLGKFSYLDEADLVNHPGLAHALTEIQRLKTKEHVIELSGNLIHKMYDTYGLDEDLLIRIAENENLQLDLNGYESYSKHLKDGAKLELALRLQESLNSSFDLKQDLNHINVCPTRNEYKYNYTFNLERGMYDIPQLNTKITSIVPIGNSLCHVVTEKSNFYFESGGQQSDKGRLRLAKDTSKEYEIKQVVEHDGFILHTIENNAPTTELSIGNEIILTVDANRRSSNIMHHTATHLLNSVARKVLQVPICQRSSFVGEKGLKLELAVCSPSIEISHVEQIELEIRKLIQQNAPIRTRICNARDLNFDQIITIPGEVYPERNLRVIEIGNNLSTELCCGTHAQSTAELQDFCITNLVQTKPGCYAFHAIAGLSAVKATLLGKQISNDVNQLKDDMDKQLIQNMANIETRMQRLKNVLLVGSENNINLPYVTRQRCLEIIHDLYKRLKEHTRESLRKFIDMEMGNLQQEKPLQSHPFIVHFLESSFILEEVQLIKATRHFTDRPILVISITDDQVKARATVPEANVNQHFDAQKWTAVVANVFKSKVFAPKGQNAAHVCNMRSRKVQTLQFEGLLERALKEASEFARKNMQ